VLCTNESLVFLHSIIELKPESDGRAAKLVELSAVAPFYHGGLQAISNDGVASSATILAPRDDSSPIPCLVVGPSDAVTLDPGEMSPEDD